MDPSRSFSFVFQDPRWLSKVAIAGLMAFISLLIVPGFILLGYMVQLYRNVLNGEAQPLPEWTDMGRYLSDGFRFFVVYLVYTLPIIVIYAIAFTVLIATNTGSSARNNPAGGVGVAVFALTSYCLAPLYGLALAVIAPSIIGRYVTHGSTIGAGLQFGEIWATTRRNLGDFLVVMLIQIGLGFVAYLGVLACFIGVIFTASYAYMVWFHLAAQAYAKALNPAAPPAGPALPPPPAPPAPSGGPL